MSERDTPDRDMLLEETGEPILGLASLTERPQPGFSGRVRTSIERRRLASELTELSWQGLRLLLLEYIDLPLRLFGAGTSDPEEPNKRGDG